MNTAIRTCLLALLLPACAVAAKASATPAASTRAPSAAELFARGVRLAAHGDALRAEQYLRAAMRAGYPEQRVIVPLVRVCIASSRLREALAHAQPFLRRHPDAWRLRYLTAAIHLALDQPGRALDELRRIVAERPDAAQAHYLMAIALRDGLRDPSAARSSFEAYLRNAPRGAHAREALAWLADQTAARTAVTTTADEAAKAEAEVGP